MAVDKRKRPGDPRPAPQGVRPPGAAPAPRAGGRADPHRAVAEHERPQPRRGLRAPARALPVVGRGARRAGGGGRGGDPPGRPRADEGGAHQADPRGARRRRPRAGSRTRRSRRRASTCATCPGVGRKTAACVLLFSYGRPEVPVDTHVYRVGTRLGLWPRGHARSSEAHDEHAAARAIPRTPTRSTCS